MHVTFAPPPQLVFREVAVRIVLVLWLTIRVPKVPSQSPQYDLGRPVTPVSQITEPQQSRCNAVLRRRTPT